MKLQTLVYAAVLATSAISSAAWAQSYERREGDARGAEHSRGDRRGDMPGPAMRRDDRRGPEREMGNRGEREREYTAREWHRGDRLPREYRDRNYVVDHWREHHLSAPPRGYEWVQVGGDYVLVSIGSGVIAQLVLAR